MTRGGRRRARRSGALPAAALGLAAALAQTVLPALPVTAAGAKTAPRPPAALDAVTCPSASRCLVVGGAGGVRLSRNGGATWARVAVPTSHYLYGIACTDVSHCVAVGDAGTALHSTDGGRRWSRGRTGVDVPLSGVACPARDRCVAVGDGNTVLTSRDGGRHWHRVDAGIGVADGVACSSATVCAVVTANATETIETINGRTWAAGTVPFSPLAALSPLEAVSCAAPTCVAVGSKGLVARSVDGGATWSAGQAPTTVDLEAVSCTSSTRCLAAGAEGAVLTSVDGGATWSASALPNGEMILGLACPTPSACTAVGSGGTITTTADGGAHWTVRAGAPAPASPLPVLVVGDSFAHTLTLGLARDAPAYGISLTDGSTDGCGVARGSPLLSGTASLTVTGPCAPDGPGWPALYGGDIAADRPVLTVLVLGAWDQSTRLIGGAWLAPGQPAYDAYERQQLASAVGILTAGGGKVVLTTAPALLALHAERCAPPPATVAGCPTETQRVAALDADARAVAASFPGQVTVVDLGGRVAPHGTFAVTVDHVVVRTSDGVHLTVAGGEWLGPWLLPRLVAAARGPG